MGLYLVPTTALSLLCAPGLHTFGQTYGQNIQRVKLSTILLKHFYRALVYPVTDYKLVLIRIYIYITQFVMCTRTAIFKRDLMTDRECRKAEKPPSSEAHKSYCSALTPVSSHRHGVYRLCHRCTCCRRRKNHFRATFLSTCLKPLNFSSVKMGFMNNSARFSKSDCTKNNSIIVRD